MASGVDWEYDPAAVAVRIVDLLLDPSLDITCKFSHLTLFAFYISVI